MIDLPFLEKWAEENGYELGGWHPNGDKIIGHFHQLHEMLPGKLVTKFVTFEKDGTVLEVTDG